MSVENKRIAARMIEEVLNNQDYAAADELLAEDFHGHSQPQDIRGPQGLRQFCEELYAAFPDFHCTILDQVAEGDQVVTRWKASGTHEGAYLGIPASGKEAAVTGIYVDRIVDGRMVETWAFWDALGLLQQLGALPEMESAR